MSLYGSLYSAVSGIRAQGVAIGIISDNISNINTVGYKAGSQYFGTLVTNSGSSSSYSPGGVRAQNRQLISQQGLVQTTASPLDIAIQGNGMFVVSTGPDGLAAGESIVYTRAGKFGTDSTGNFINSAGYYLQAWPLDANGDIPSNSSSLGTLQTVNIGEAFGEAAATTTVDLKVNLNAAETVLAGTGQIGTPGTDGANTENQGIQGNSIIVPNANLGLNFAGSDFDGDALRVTTASTFADDFVYGGFTQGNNITGTILGSTTATQPFNGAGVASGDAFTIIVNGDAANPRKFTYVSSSPVTEDGEFNSLQTLAAAINASTGLNARVATVNTNEVRLFVSAEDARQSVAFAQVAGSTANFPTALGLANIPASAANRWNTLEGLAELANNETQGRLKAEVLEATSANARINLYNANPLTTIQFANNNADADVAALGNFITELQISSTQLDPAYDAVAGSTAKSMSAGTITPDFERSFTVYDSLGTAHEVRVGFVKVGTNSWRAELYAATASEITSTVTGGDANDRFIAAAAVTFDGNGNLSSLSPNWLTSPPSVRWTGGASTGLISFDLGTTGLKDGLSQSAGLYTSTVTQNGAAVGLLDTVSIDDDGFVIANFNNGQSKKLYKIPVATFSNYDGMQSRNGNVFIQTLESGDVNLAESGSGGAGSITPESLETSNSELSEELTDMIVAQRAYQASAKVITTADELLDELNRLT